MGYEECVFWILREKERSGSFGKKNVLDLSGKGTWNPGNFGCRGLLVYGL
jgi:hypothetical protein